ncbi:hypothetical protein FOZ63_000820 [Perkinsus olseni]|uniref:Alpha-2-macroglobulin domain-containing protein n=2 Tax=Perkinsus olseni TaxID=32597 RepID=A0A7J6U4P1_PEROL|nr:hypothetical protein FOZ63_000820 [Perkinsus olseni]
MVHCPMMIADMATSELLAIVIEVDTLNGNPPVRGCREVTLPAHKLTSYAFPMESLRCSAELLNESTALPHVEVVMSCSNPYSNAQEDTFIWVTWPGGHTGIVPVDTELDTITQVLELGNISALGNSITLSAYVWQAVTEAPFSLVNSSIHDESAVMPDWSGPRYTSGKATLDMKGYLSLPHRTYDPSFSIDTDQEEYSPGDEVTLSIMGGVPNGSVIIAVVDQGILDLKPLTNPDTVEGIIDMLGTASSRMIDSHSFIASSKTLEDNAQHLWGIASEDPWFGVSFDPYWLDDEYTVYLDTPAFEQPLGPGNYKSYYPNRRPGYQRSRCPHIERGIGREEVYALENMNMDAPGVSPAAGRMPPEQDAAATPPSPGVPRLVSDTPSTLYFDILELTSAGDANISFTLGQERTKYKISAYMIGYDHATTVAATDLKAVAQVADASTPITVASPIYMEPYIPRSLRITDEPVMGVALISTHYTTQQLHQMNLTVVVSNMSAGIFPTVDASYSSDLLVLPLNAGVLYALFKMPVVSTLNIDDTTDSRGWVYYTLYDTTEVIIDEIIVQILIGPHSHPIVVGSSRAIAAPGVWEEHLQLPEYIPSASQVRLSAESSFYPRVIEHCHRTAFTPYNMYDEDKGDIRTDLLIATLYCLGAVRAEDISLGGEHDTATLRDELLHQLIHIHTVDGVLKWSRNSPYPSYVSIWLHSLAIIALRGHTQSQYSVARTTWLKAAIDSLKDTLDRFPDARPYDDVARLYHATGSSDLDGLPLAYSKIDSFREVLTPSDSMTAWLLMRVTVGQISSEDAQAVIWNNIRVSSSETAYIARPGQPSPLPDHLQALALHLATVNNEQHEERRELLWRVGVWLGQGGVEAKWGGIYSQGFSTETLLFAIEAFTVLDASMANGTPQIEMTVSDGDGDTIWETSLTEENPVSGSLWLPTVNSTNTAVQPSSSSYEGPLIWNITGNGTAFTFLTANILPKHPFAWPIDRGFTVRKFIQLFDVSMGQCTGGMLTSAVTGQLVCITINIESHDDVRSLIVEDLSPSGLEPQDDNIDSLDIKTAGSSSSGAPDYYHYESQHSAYSVHSRTPVICANSRWWLPCRRVTKRTGKDTVLWEIDGISSGEDLTLSYLATANVPGDYALPQTKCYDTSNPTYMGMSGYSRFAVAVPGGTLSVIPTGTPEIARRALLGEGGSDCVGTRPLDSSWCDLSSGDWMCGTARCTDEATNLQGCSGGSDGQVACTGSLRNLTSATTRASFSSHWIDCLTLVALVWVIEV